ncbi:leucine-rich repeat protein [Butyrivibrio sp. WCD3002]|uniref:leucine-rich repeat protein n=1 Tax=Butyrivibrio sp. WCD3002 TaxID=1280676 RepID=UPI000419E331|nr:leucine-rich repeat protein [Butyrivibrio sp. WCD3002]
MKNYLKWLVLLVFSVIVLGVSTQVHAEEDTYTVTLHAGEGYFNNTPEKKTKKIDYIDINATKINVYEYINSNDHIAGNKLITGWFYDEELTQPVKYAAVDDEDDAEEEDYFNAIVSPQNNNLYAAWGDAAVITYDPNGGFFFENGEKINTFSQLCAPGESVNLRIDRIRLSNRTSWGSNYGQIGTDQAKYFKGWSKKKNGSVITSYQATEDATLYAVWADAYVVTIDGNGGQIVNDNVAAYKIEKGRSFKSADINVSLPDKQGSVFAGYSRDKNDRENIITSLENYFPTEDVTFYAMWDDGCEVTFDAGEGYIVDIDHPKTDGPFSIKSGASFKDVYGHFPTKAYAPGKAFIGWNTQADGTGTTIKEDTPISGSGEKTLYAQYTSNVWSVRYKCIDGEFDGNPVTGDDGPFEEYYEYVKKGDTITLEDHGYYRHYKNETCSHPYCEDGNSYELQVNADITIYVKYDPDNGVDDPDDDEYQLYVDDSELSIKPGQFQYLYVYEQGGNTVADPKYDLNIRYGNNLIEKIERGNPDEDDEDHPVACFIIHMADTVSASNATANLILTSKSQDGTQIYDSKEIIVSADVTPQYQVTLSPSYFEETIGKRESRTVSMTLDPAPEGNVSYLWEIESSSGSIPDPSSVVSLSDTNKATLKLDFTGYSQGIQDGDWINLRLRVFVDGDEVDIYEIDDEDGRRLYRHYYDINFVNGEAGDEPGNNSEEPGNNDEPHNNNDQPGNGNAAGDNNQNGSGNQAGQNNTPAAQNPAPAEQNATPAANGTEIDGNTAGKNGNFKVVSSDANAPAVAYEAAFNKKAKKVAIPSSVKDANGVEYAVTEVSSSACSKNKKLQSVTIPGTVTKIGSKAFSGCENLDKIKIYGNNLTSVGKNAFKNIKKGAKITVVCKDKKTFNKLVKKLKKAGAKGATFKFKKG